MDLCISLHLFWHLCWSSEMHLYSSRRLTDTLNSWILYSSGVVGKWNLSFHLSIQILFLFYPFENLLSCWCCLGRSKFLHGKFLVSTVPAHFLLFSASSSISKGGSRKTPSGRVAESRRYRRKTSVRCSNLRRRLLAWTRSSSQVPGAQRPLFFSLS